MTVVTHDLVVSSVVSIGLDVVVVSIDVDFVVVFAGANVVVFIVVFAVVFNVVDFRTVVDSSGRFVVYAQLEY